MKKIYFSSTEEILEGLTQYEKVAKALHMNGEKRWTKFLTVIDVLVTPAYKKVIEKCNTSSKGTYDSKGDDWDAFKAELIYCKIKTPYPWDTMIESFHNWFKYLDMDFEVEIEEHIKRVLVLLKYTDDSRGRTTGGLTKPKLNNNEKTHYLSKILQDMVQRI